MKEVRERTETFLEDDQERKRALETVLDVDAEKLTWTFHDVPLDSGTFGELVSRGIVENDDEEYRLTDRDAVRAALSEEATDTTSESSGVEVPPVIPTLDQRSVVAAGLAILSVIVIRLLTVTSVFQNDLVVLMGNDPYFYRYWTERMVAAGSGPFDAALGTDIGSMANGEPLLVATLSWWTELLGGPNAAGDVLAWYPVVAAAISASLLYLTVRILTTDRRIALATVVLLAVTPEHALRTALGFADHHAFDFVWLTTTLLGVLLADRAGSIRTTRGIVGTLLVAVGVASQVLAWEAGPLLIAPLGLYAVVRSIHALRAGERPIVVLSPLIVATGVASGLVWGSHVAFGWHSSVVATTPALLFVGTLVVTGIAELASRSNRSPRELLGLQVLAGILLSIASFVAIPGLAEELIPRLEFLFGAPDIAESQSLFSPESGSVFAPAIAFGFSFFVGVPYLAWITSKVVQGNATNWIAPVVYCWWFFVLAIIQMRFAGELSTFLAIFSGVGFVHLAAAVDITPDAPGVLTENTKTNWQPSIPSTSTALSVVVLFALVGGFGAVQTPIHMSKVTIGSDTISAAAWTDDYTDEQDMEYPDNYVFSQWGENRVFNYFVNGKSDSYGYAKSNYRAFLHSTNGTDWYERLHDADRAGFIVTRTLQDTNATNDSLYIRLHKNWGSQQNSTPGLGHYRAVYASDDSSLKVFETVPGGKITAPAPPGKTVTISTDTEVSGHKVTYRRTVEAYPAGVVQVTVPYATTYTVSNTTIRVNENAVRTGGSVNAFEGPGASWEFDNASGTTAFDTKSGNHGILTSAQWNDTQHSSSIELEAKDLMIAENATIGVDDAEKFSLSIRFQTNASADYQDDLKYPRLALHGSRTPFRNTEGYQIAMAEGRLLAVIGDGDEVAILRGPRVDDAEWHNATLQRNGSQVKLVLDGTVVETSTWEGTLDVDGKIFTAGNGFSGAIDVVSVDIASEPSNTTRTDTEIYI